MKAMILAAGRGSRMSPTEEGLPKPLIPFQRLTLIEHQILKLQKAGFCELVINVSYKAERIQQALGDGSRYNVHIDYSVEPIRLETGGGIKQALPLLGTQPFLVTNADLVTDFPYETLKKALLAPKLAHLVLAPNPAYHPKGDYGLTDNGLVSTTFRPFYTFTGIYVLDPHLFDTCDDTIFRIPSLLTQAMTLQEVSGEIYKGKWLSVDTPERLVEAAK